MKPSSVICLQSIITAMTLLAAVCMPSGFCLAVDAEKTIETIIAGVEKRYNVAGFTADFDQESILKAMAVTDMASGTVMVRQPDMMRWEYLAPDPQTIITDGNDLWVYRPQENQVLVGKAPALFGDGKGAGFISDIKTVRQRFQVSLETSADPHLYRLRMIPNQSSPDIMSVILDVSKASFDLRRIVTTNVYGDETRITFNNLRFDAQPPSMFRFDVPEGADVIQMNP